MSFTDKRIYGRNAVLSISIDGGTTFKVAGCSSSITVSRATAVEEVAPCIGSGTAGQWAAKEPGQKSWGCSIDQLINYGVGVEKAGFLDLEIAWKTDVKPHIKLVYTEGTDTVTEQGACVIASLDASYSGANEAATASLSLEGDGEITLTKVEA